MNAFIRENVIFCSLYGDENAPYKEADIFTYTETQQRAVRRKRAGKSRLTSPKQKNLNDKRAKRYFVALAEANFFIGDLAVHLQYKDEYQPATPEEGLRNAVNFIRRVNYQRAKRGLSPTKYLLVTQVGRAKRGGHHIHHHLLLSAGMGTDERDLIESLWWREKERRKDGEIIRPRDMWGSANADRLQDLGKGIQNMVGYIVQDSVTKKHWTQSQNLILPWQRPDDERYNKRRARRQLAELTQMPPTCEHAIAFWERQYPGYKIIEIQRDPPTEHNGWAFHLKMRKRE